ncbi:bifunctional transaldolase/phosoglucose isomerase [soil metagenome]
MAKNPLQRLHDYGQSVWNDNLSRQLIVSGELQNLIDNYGVVGVTSNPSIFDTAISKSNDYDELIQTLVADGRTSEEIYEELVVRDIQMAADILRPIYDKTGGHDGFVSLEVSPELAHDTEKSITDARRLWERVHRPNVMIKIPGTDEGLPAIEQMLYEGVNINITLLFSLDAYRKVAEAYIHALERRVADGKPVDELASVASFFVSRVDTEVDSQLQAIIDSEPDSDRATIAKAILGKVAIANAKLAYQVFGEMFHSDRFSELAGRGAAFQRPLWASTSTKNPDYPDTLYVDELIGPNTVETLAPASIKAFADHGTVGPTLEADVNIAYETMAALEEIGIRYEDVDAILVREGVASFAKSFDSLMSGLEEKRARIAGELTDERNAQLGKLGSVVEGALRATDSSDIPARLQRHDPSLWSDDKGVQQKIANRLGWLSSVKEMLDQAEVGVFEQFASDVQQRGYKHVVLLGMGGSSLAPEVIATIYGPQTGFPELTVLDTTNPATIARVTEMTRSERTLFIVSSKSGSTVETRTLFHHFLESRNGIASDFVTITDPGSPLETEAREVGCWRVFTNRPDIGGRYSALSCFGLIPAAAIGVDVEALLRRAVRLLPIHDTHHPGIWLGVALAAAQKEGRDKLTLIASGSWQSFGDWLEQLVAESTGKEGAGVIPVVRETARNPEDYGHDRIFGEVRSVSEMSPALAPQLRDNGHPVFEQTIHGPEDLGAEFLLWEIATAVAGQQLGINPFDEPNVQEAKDATNAVLTSPGSSNTPAASPREAIERVTGWISDGDYLAIMAYVDRTQSTERALENLRDALGAQTEVATTLGYGPRFLHSTGQLHKGGPASGVFLQIVDTSGPEIDIPDESFSFEQLFAAQSVGDHATLDSHGLRVVRVEADGNVDQIVRALTTAASGASVAAD